ncbi:MAG: polyprenyl glycosylphosphotransferase [Porticoccaceae bacterium]|nr:polyprenyl glycosylphosphotransferase [Porticoccaceae bacterium]
MIRLRHKLLIHGLRIFDQLSLAISLFIVVALAKGVNSLPHIYIVFNREYKLFESVGLILMLVAWTFVSNRFIKYDTGRFVSFNQQVYRLFKASTTTAFILLLAGVVFDFETLGLKSIAIFWCTNNLFGLFARCTVRLLLRLTRSVKSNFRNVIIVGTNPDAKAFAKKVADKTELGYQIIGYITAPYEAPDEAPKMFLGQIEKLPEILETEKIDEVIICIPFQRNIKAITQIITLGYDLGIVVRFTPESNYTGILKSLNIETFDGNTIITFFRESHVLQLLIKRFMDIAGSALMLLLLSPLLALVALLVKLDSKGPILFAQERVGMNKRSFKLLKFRSMVANAEELKAKLVDQNEVDGPVFKIKKDPRITRVGRFIRKTSIDELPQLWNAFIGDISLVGPRPPLFSEVDQYQWLFRRRISVKPGITCLWQVSGRNELSFDEWMELDKQYIENWSIWLDLKILLKTIPAILLGRGAS